MTRFAGIRPNITANAKPHQIAILAFDGVVLGDLAIPLEIFGRIRDPRGQPRYDIRVYGSSREVRTEHMRLEIGRRLSSLKRVDTVIVPGIDNIERPIHPDIRNALRRSAKQGARIASICTGAFVLAQAGLLDHLRVTTHWLVAKELARRYPAVSVDAAVLYVDNGQILTSAGAAAGMDLCLHMIRSDHGAVVASFAARAAVMPLERSGGQSQFIVHEAPEAAESMGPLLVWMEQNLKRRLTLSVIARHTGMSKRTLSRRFLEQVGATPAHWIAKARVRRAQHLLETTLWPIEGVATESGFRSASVLREHFAASVGVSPQAYRRSFGHQDVSG